MTPLLHSSTIVLMWGTRSQDEQHSQSPQQPMQRHKCQELAADLTHSTVVKTRGADGIVEVAAAAVAVAAAAVDQTGAMATMQCISSSQT